MFQAFCGRGRFIFEEQQGRGHFLEFLHLKILKIYYFYVKKDERRECHPLAFLPHRVDGLFSPQFRMF
jgi:hypothetical protein